MKKELQLKLQEEFPFMRNTCPIIHYMDEWQSECLRRHRPPRKIEINFEWMGD
jgi:hypothetical protein